MSTEQTAFRRELARVREQSDNGQLIDRVERLISELEQDRRENGGRLDWVTENLRSFDYESGMRPRGTTWHERELFHERWGGVIQHGDPYYNPNLTRSSEDCSLFHG